MTVRKLFWWAYLAVLHLAVLLVLAAIPEVRNRFQMQKRLPGSRLTTLYDNRPGQLGRFIMHDDRVDPVLTIIDRPFGVDHILVAPPGSRFVWSFDREEGQEWKLFVSEFDTIEQADHHLQNPQANRVSVDGYPDGGLDGFPDRELIIEDGVKKVYTIEPKVHTLKYETPVSEEP